MPALSGQVIMMLTNDQGLPVLTVTWFFNPTTRALRNNPTAWTAPDGTVYAAGTGALIADNQLGRTVRVRINDENGALVRRVNIPAGGRSVTANQLANAPAPDGPYITADDLNGLTFDVV
ncbi:hypothetical protein Q0Z83_060220 [Actinoplanes sichuanensis]|uniref:Uncharacterized protein n=1 Tax=Actinoplanes sichuanensis TaxID=512349 RepID=A0ABW4A6N5_9ACTN|nr:hypothetical protein [Actinoplanes sichuanensis]BEL07831.1 hypothetical protein Q0Z83_060220 [Actinoplanes sichuanensis]